MTRWLLDSSSILEGLTFDTDGNLNCGTMSNVYLVRKRSVVYPDLSRAGIAGIMRRKVVEDGAREKAC